VHEVDICSMLRKSVKHTRLITSIDSIIDEFVFSWSEMLRGRPGPVHLDIPLDIQSSKFQRFNPAQVQQLFEQTNDGCASKHLEHSEPDVIATEKILNALHASRLPVILAGYGVFLSNTVELVDEFSVIHGIPFLSTKNLYGHLSSIRAFHPGHVGTYGCRIANMILQSSDFLLVLGSRLAAPVTGYDVNLFAPHAQIFIIDIDTCELQNMNINAEKICAPLQKILPLLLDKSRNSLVCKTEWSSRIHELTSLIGEIDRYDKSLSLNYINPYWFIETIINFSPDNCIFTYDQGAAYYCSTLSNNLKPGQLMFSNGGLTPMGYGLPAAIGAWYASKKSRPIICIHGDGGLQMNVQELQTIRHHNIPIKLFVYSNEGYLSIKNTQDAYFSGRYYGSDPSSGLSCPSFMEVARGYGIASISVETSADLIEALPNIMSSLSPLVIEMKTDPHQIIAPRVASRVNADGTMSSSPLHDMTPKLDIDKLTYLFPDL